MLNRPPDVTAEAPRIAHIDLLDEAHQPTDTLRLGEPLRFRVHLQSHIPSLDCDVIIRIETSDALPVTTIRSSDYQQWYTVTPDAPIIVSATLDSLFLEPSQYYLTVLIRDKQRNILDHLPRVTPFTVQPHAYGINAPPLAIIGVVTAHSHWSATVNNH